MHAHTYICTHLQEHTYIQASPTCTASILALTRENGAVGRATPSRTGVISEIAVWHSSGIATLTSAWNARRHLMMGWQGGKLALKKDKANDDRFQWNPYFFYHIYNLFDVGNSTKNSFLLNFQGYIREVAKDENAICMECKGMLGWDQKVIWVRCI